MRHVAIALLHLVMTIALANAQDRGAMTIQVPVDGRKESRQLYSASHALVIGIDKYTDNGWPPLHNAISDAEKIANALREHGFKVMFAKNLKSAELISTLQDFFINTGKDPEARLLLWYAGHGHSMPEPSEEGYLVPADAPPAKTDTEFRRKALALSLFSYLMTQARAKHVLAVFDSCFSGTALAITRDAEMTGPPEIALQTGGRARQIISSGDRNQKVSDNGNFRQIFLDAISGKVPNVGSNGYVTAQELGAYLRREMSRLTVNTATPQTPNTGYLARVGYNLGDFVFRVPGKGVASAEPVRPTPPPPPIPCDEVPLQVGEEQKCVKSGFGKVEWFKDCPTCPEMVMVPAGKFTMGSPVNEPERDENIEAQLEVTISKPFAVGRFAVTRSEFAVFVRDANHVMEEKCVIELSVGIGPHPVLPATAVPMMAARKAFRSPQLGEAMELLIDAENILERAFTAARAARSSAAAGTGTTAAQLLVTSRHVETTLSLVEEVARLQDRIEDLTWRAEREHRLAPNGMDMATKDELARVLDGVIGLKKRADKAKEMASTNWNLIASNAENLHWRAPGFPQSERHPVTCVSWNDAKAYVDWLTQITHKTYRLLSEAEREYVTRAGTSEPFWWGLKIDTSQANYDGTRSNSDGAQGEFRGGTVPADYFGPNPWGLYHVHGNVWEHTEDCWSPSNTENPADGSATKLVECEFRVVRGGSWQVGPSMLRSASRDRRRPDQRSNQIGFRVARTIE